MSIKLMSRVWEIQIPHNLRTVLLLLADIANDDGTDCYPSVEYIAWKTDYSESNVRRILRALRSKKYKLIELDGDSKGGRGRTNHYRIRLENGVPKPPFVPSWKRIDEEDETGGEAPEDDLDIADPVEDGSENPTIDARVYGTENPSKMTGFVEGAGENPSTRARETLAPARETLAPVRENPSIAMHGDPSITVKEPPDEPLGCPDVLSATSGADEETPKWAEPDYWHPMTQLEGYARKKYEKFVAKLERTCEAQGVSPEMVVAEFAAFYAGHKYLYGWIDPVASLRKTLSIQISKIKKKEGGANSPYQSAHQRRIESEKSLPAPKFTRRN